MSARNIPLGRKYWSCADKCFGWHLFNGSEIQKCDTSERFVDDDEAQRHVAAVALEAARIAEDVSSDIGSLVLLELLRKRIIGKRVEP